MRDAARKRTIGVRIMAAFEYEALDTAGRRLRGVISAETPRLARRELRRKQLVPLKLEAANRRKVALPKILEARARALSHKDISLLTRQLSTLISAAMPVEEALQTMGLQAETTKMRKILLSVRGRVMEGYRLSDALGEEKGAFSPFYRAMVAAGEASGGLGAVLERLADHLEKANQMRGKVMTALAYPAFLAIMATVVIMALMAFVVPRVVEQFSSMGQELPLLTRSMITISEAMQSVGPVVLVALVIGIILFLRLLRQVTFRRRVDGLVLKIPLIGKLVRKLQAARFARTLSTLVASGSSMMDALQAAERTLTNTVIRDSVREMAMLVREGTSLSGALKKIAVFPPLVTYMAKSGESSGQLDLMLEKAADYLEGEFETFTATVLTLLEPGIIVIMGGIVTLIVLSILLPILQMNSLALM